jgi:hypothetical protein
MQVQLGDRDQIGCYTFRATGITAYLANGGALEHAQEMATHESPRTTKLYDRTRERLTVSTSFERGSVRSGSAINLAHDVGDTFWSHLSGVLAIGWYLAMIAGPKRFRPAVSGHCDLAAQNHDPHVEVAVRMHILGDPGLLAAMNDLKALAAQVALKRLAREWPAVAAAAGDVGDALGADVLGMHAVGGHLTALPGTEGFRIIVAGNGDLTAKDKEPGVEIVAVIGYPQVRCQTGVDDAVALAPQFRFEFETIH